MPRLLSLLPLFILSLANITLASNSCIAFDISWNLLAFGFSGKDYNAGTQDTWTSSGNPTDITTQGRPPFDGANTTCYLSQFTNAIYVLGADSAKPSSIYIYDATAKSWSTQDVSTDAGIDPTNFAAILDHDTNVFYAYSKGELFSLDMELLKAASSSSKSWNDVQKLAFDTDGYKPVMALAQNHIHFLGVPGLPDGSAQIFVIHFSFLQPEPQSYGNFPNTHGQVTSLFQEQGVQQEFAFIPDDGSATYVINVETNTTQTLKGPTVKDPFASYFASVDSIVQLSSSGSVAYLSYNVNSSSANSAATWNVISKLPVASTTSTGSTGNGSSSTGSSNSGSSNIGSSGSPTSTGNAQSSSTGSSNSALSIQSQGLFMAAMLLIIVVVSQST
ncbi:hypothetical protein BDQ12DRAFT_692020 [Crucibulum laeve]|uniref:Uncharacterized protein n=1 Tax=Crucibulum laeve TaxID=68775 RepID=A0A5C3LJ17_9AGAR|nr:hypothetical protein BDQ12DRAFT_692020 [Crucibulum laeve]